MFSIVFCTQEYYFILIIHSYLVYFRWVSKLISNWFYFSKKSYCSEWNVNSENLISSPKISFPLRRLHVLAHRGGIQKHSISESGETGKSDNFCFTYFNKQCFSCSHKLITFKPRLSALDFIIKKQ